MIMGRNKKTLMQFIIIALLIIGIVLYFMFFNKDISSPVTPQTPAASQTGEVPAVSPALPDTPGKTGVTTEPVQIEIDETIVSNTLKGDDGKLIFRYSIVLPKASPDGNAAAAKINEYYGGIMEKAMAYTDQTASLAKDDSGSPNFLSPYTYSQVFEIEFSSEEYLSIRRVTDCFEGGSHSLTSASFDVFDLSTGDRVTLADLFSVGREVWSERLMTLVSQQIKAAGNSSDSGWTSEPAGLASSFNENDFCIGEDGLILVFQPYSIAPYSEGIPEFRIPFDAISDILVEE